MKNIWKILTGLMLIASTAYLTSCVKGDFDEPPIYIPTVDFEANTTIAELKASYTGLRLIEEDIIIKGIVIANDESGNLYKKLIIQDETAGIELALDKTNLYNEFKVGQRVFIKCRNMYIGDYNNLIQLGHLFNNNIGRLPEVFINNHVFRDSLAGPVPDPLVVSPSSLNTQLISRLVTFENIRFVEPGTEWAPQTADATNRAIAGSSTVVRTSKYSNFASAPVPDGYGDVTGVLSIFGSTYQLTIRDLNDVGEFDGEAPPPPPGSGDGSKENPYTVAQAIQMQNANPYVIGFVKGHIVGSVKSGVTSVGSADDINFTGPFSSNTNVLIADDPNETNYLNCVIVNLPAGSSLRTEVNLQTNPENLGKWLNVKGTLRTYFGVAGLRDFSGEPGDFVFEGSGGGGGGGGGTGDGSKENPYTVAQAIEMQNANPYVIGFVKGYIIGSVKAGVTSVGSSDDINFSAPFSSNTNVLIADDPNETNYLNSVIVNLPAGSSLRTEVNLQTNPENLGKWLNVKGTLRTYFGVAGLRDFSGDANDFEFEGGGGGGGGGGGAGSGTQSDPYDVATAIEKQNATPYVVGWVKGYIVGSVKTGVTSISSSDDIHFAPPFTSATNVLLADNANETNYLNCVIVNLPAGKPLRSQVNLMDNPDNLGKWLKVTGTLRTYFGVAGLRDSNGELADFELESGGGGGGTSIFLEDFTSSLGSFSAYSVTGDQQWGWASYDGGCAVMSGYFNEINYANEDWLISPAISLAGQTGVSMNFREAINYITQISDMKVLISTNYPGSGNPNTSGDWTELSGFTRAPGNNWTFVNSGDVSLSAYEGQTIRIAFKYLSTTSGAATWEISRVEVK